MIVSQESDHYKAGVNTDPQIAKNLDDADQSAVEVCSQLGYLFLHLIKFPGSSVPTTIALPQRQFQAYI